MAARKRRCTGGFYKHFGSKADLMAEAASCGIAQTLAKSDGADFTSFTQQYLSRRHRDALGQGCTLAALGTDAGRQPEPVREVFADGLERLLAALRPADGEDAALAGETRTRQLATIAQVVGAIVLSRACPDDSPLADDILAACRAAIASPPAVS